MKNLYHSINRIILPCLALAIAVSAQAQTIPNPSFETDTFTVPPGYVSGNGPITGWTDNSDLRVGLNPAGGSPFADNGVIPNGVNVAFIQSDSTVADGVTLGTIISGLTVGQTYTVNFRVNARAGNEANLSVDIDSTRIIDTAVNAVNSGPYKYFAFNFTASAASQTMTLRNASGGDNTALVDDFSIAPINSGWSYAAWTSDADSGVDGTKTYTHSFNFGTGASATINGITFTGVAGGSPSLAGSFSTANLPNVFPGDANNLNTGGSQQLASDFVYGNPPTMQSITISGLFPGYEYMATIFSVGWENGTRAATFAVGDDRLTINQDQFGDNNGIRVSYRYVATANSITLTYTPLQGATFHTYGFANYVLNAASTPTIGQQPLSQCVGIGQPVTFSVTAAGSEPLSYQWRKDTIDISGANSSTYTIPTASPSDAGAYSVVVSNPSDSVTSDDAILQVGLTLVNPSFEVDTFTVFPGYVSGNGPITGWNALDGHGINPGGGSPFADNGTIPDGHQVAFMQQDGAMSQIISGFIPGTDYYVIYFENARSGGIPAIEVKMGDTTIVQTHLRAPVGGVNPYVKMTSEPFTAESDTLQLSFIKSNPLGGDTTALIDAICILELPDGTPPSIMVPPQDLIVTVGDSATFTVTAFGSPPFSYQWLKDGTAIVDATSRSYTIPIATKGDEGIYSVKVTNPVDTIESSGAKLTVFEAIPDLYSTGLDNSRAPLADGQTDPHYTLIINPNPPGGPDAIVEQSTAFPIAAGPWLPDTSLTKWIGPQLNTSASAGGRYVYRTTIDLTDRDPSTVVIIGQWSVDNTGVDIQVNGVTTLNPSNPGFNVFTPFAIASSNATFVAGPNTIDFVADNAGAGYCGLMVQILQSNVRVPPGIPPSIIGQPQSQTAIAGDNVSFRVAATGSQPLHYQWLKDDVEIPGAQGTVLNLHDISFSDVGTYTVQVFNDAGDKLSDPATLCINYRRVPGVVFGTGTDETGGLAANGAVDLHYILSESADPSYPGTDAIVADDNVFPISTHDWVASGPKSKWIAPFADQSVGNLEGNYTYQTFFDLTGFDISQVQIAGAWAVDNTGLDILVNGVSTGITSPGFGGMTPFVIKNDLIAGPNVIDFKMNNAPTGVNPTGLRVDLDLLIPLSPVMTVSQSGTDLIISWSPTQPCQRLQAADSVTGPWNPIIGFKSGDKFDTTTSPQKFFKIVQ